MVKRRRHLIPYILILVLSVAIAIMLLYILPYRYKLTQTVGFSESYDYIANPLFGYAPDAQSLSKCENSNLVYITVSWRDWEPREGFYDIASLETKYHIPAYKEQNKHAVLRFTCDIPGKTEHRDIPDWLYNLTADGIDYNTSYGKGYSPNYENTLFIKRHSMAIEKLAEYCNKDSFVAFVELGSLGHWGEWHTNKSEGINLMPSEETCWSYVLDYTNNFTQARLLMRQNFIYAEEANIGLYNDMFGDTSATQRWLDHQQEIDEKVYPPLTPTPERWISAPIGGEFTSGIAMNKLLDKDLPDVLDTLHLSHMTFLGPKCPTGDEADTVGSEAVLSRLGYRFFISQLESRYNFATDQIDIFLTWENTGSAPMYWDWPATMYVYDLADNLLYWETLSLKTTELLPNTQMITESHIPFTDHFRTGYKVGIGIESPNEQENIQLCQESLEMFDNQIQIIYIYDNVD